MGRRGDPRGSNPGVSGITVFDPGAQIYFWARTCGGGNRQTYALVLGG